MTSYGMSGPRWILVLAIGAVSVPGCSPPPPPNILPPPAVGGHNATRPQLEHVADSLRAFIAASAGMPIADTAKNQLETVEERLEMGDFRRGDVVLLTVEDEPRWTDTFTVRPNQTIELPDIDPVSLQGALYSEGADRIREYLSEYIRDPRIIMETTKRVAVLGDVGRPGFYDVPGPELLSAAIMDAGGPGQNARMDKVELRRGGQAIARLPSDYVQSLTLDELGVESGDEIFVPSLEQSNLFLRNVALVLGVVASAVALIAFVF